MKVDNSILMNKSVKKNYIYNVTYQLLTMLAPLITTPYVSHELGAENIGIYSYTSSIVSYFVLFAAMGTASYGQREIAYNQDNRKERTRIFWNTELLSCISTMICVVLFWLFSYIFMDNNIMYYILSMNIIAVALDVSWLFQGMEEFGVVVSRNIIFKLANIVSIFIFVKGRNSLITYTLIMAFLPLVSTFSLWPFIKKIVDKPSLNEINPFKDLKTVISMFMPTIAISIYSVLDKTMIGMFSASRIENGYYEQATKLSKTVLTVVTSLGTVMVPRVGYYYRNDNIELVRRYMYRSYKFVWILGMPLCFGLIGISDNLVPWFYGQEYYKVSILLKILSFLIIAIGINNVTGMQYLMPTGRQSFFTYTVAIGAIVNFLLNLVLIPNLYSVGAAVASVLAESIIAVIQLILVRRELNNVKIVKYSFKYFFASAIMLTVINAEKKYITTTFWGSCCIVFTGVTVYLLILCVIKDDEIIKYINKIKVFLNKGK